MSDKKAKKTDNSYWAGLLDQVRSGSKTPQEALEALKDLPYADLGFAKVDHHRAFRSGFPEVVFSQGKTTLQTTAIVKELLSKGGPVLVTRCNVKTLAALSKKFAKKKKKVCAGTVLFLDDRTPPPRGLVLIVCAGTADLPVAEEAALTAEALGARTEKVVDVGVAGIHRLLAEQGRLDKANAIVVVAGMEGALPSVVGGLTSKPVLAVPTSVGYGASFGGVAALLGMLNSCAAGVVVSNIDNGFGAGFAAGRINKLVCDAQERNPRQSKSQHNKHT